MSEFATSLRSLASKLETSGGIAETLTDADNNVRVWDLAVGALNVPMDADPSKYATGDFFLGESIPGPTSAQITFNTKFCNNGVEEPNWSKFVKGCGCTVTEEATGEYGSGYTIYPDSTKAETTLTFGVYDLERGVSPSGEAFMFAGSIGNCTINVEGAGKTYVMNYEYTGALNSVSDIAGADVPALSGVQATIGDTFQGGSGTFGGVELCISTMEFNFGNTIAPVECMNSTTGYSKFAITAMEPTLTVNPLLTRETDYDFWTKFTAGTIENVQIHTDQFSLDIPRAQITSASVEDADGIVRTPLTMRPLRATTEGLYDYAPWELRVLSD